MPDLSIFPDGAVESAAYIAATTRPLRSLAPVIVASSAWTGGPYETLPYRDPTILQFGGSEQLGLYRRLRRQLTAVSGPFARRLYRALSLPLTWHPGDAANPDSVDLAEVLDELYARIPDRISVDLMQLQCIPDGVAFTEVIYSAVDVPIVGRRRRQSRDTAVRASASSIEARVETWQAPVNLIDREPGNFRFRPKGELLFIPGDGVRDPFIVDPRQIIVSRFGSAQEYGLGECSDIYIDGYKIDSLDKFGLDAVERSAQQFIAVTVPVDYNDDQIAQQTTWLRANYRNWVVIRGEVEKPETSFPSGMDLAKTFLGPDQIARIRELKDSISRRIDGSTLSQGSGGSYARDAVGDSVSWERAVVDGETRSAFWLKWRDLVMLINAADLPRELWPYPQIDSRTTADVTAFIESAKAAQSMGQPISRAQMAEVASLDIPADDDDTLKPRFVETAAGIPKQVGDGFGTGSLGGSPVTNPGQPDSGLPPGQTAVFADEDGLYDLRGIEDENGEPVLRLRRRSA